MKNGVFLKLQTFWGYNFGSRDSRRSTKGSKDAVDLLVSQNFWGYNFGSRDSRRSTKGSKDADDLLVSTKSLSQKMSHSISAQGLVKLIKNLKTCPLCDVTKRKSLI